MDRLHWGADGVAKGNFAGINIWCICGVPYATFLKVKDSKKTNRQQRIQIVEEIKDKVVYGLGTASPNEIDRWGIKVAESMSLNRAFTYLVKQGYQPNDIYGDLDMPNLDKVKQERLKAADGYIDCVSAASILAKYALDLYWDRVHEYYPEYKFISNAGYGLAAKNAIQEYGLLKGIHRESYKPCKQAICLI